MYVVDEMARIVVIVVVLASALAGLLGCGERTRSSAPRAISMLPARTPDGLVSIPWTLGGVHGDTVSVRYNDSDCGYSFAHPDAVETSQTVTIVGAGEKLTPLRRLRFDPPGGGRRRPG